MTHLTTFVIKFEYFSFLNVCLMTGSHTQLGGFHVIRGAHTENIISGKILISKSKIKVGPVTLFIASNKLVICAFFYKLKTRFICKFCVLFHNIYYYHIKIIVI